MGAIWHIFLLRLKGVKVQTTLRGILKTLACALMYINKFNCIYGMLHIANINVYIMLN